MKRAIIRLTAEGFGRSPLNLGRADENIAVRVEIDLSRILAQEPTAKAHITVESPSKTKYPAVTSMDGTKLIWDVTKADNTVEGTGYAQLTVKGPNNEVLKSAVAMTRIGHSIRGEGLAPDPVQNWVDDAANKLNSVAQAGEEATKAASSANAAAEAANTAAKNAQTIADTVQEKLDNGEFVGPAGKDGEQGPQGKPGSDAAVTADNIQSALGYTPVKDVQVGGTSVLDGGVAKVPIAQSDVPGVVKTLPPQDSGIWNDNGSLKISYATDAEISSRRGNRKTIVCTNLDYAAKAAMCDGKGAAWTDAEQKAARDRMGIDKAYELIEEIVLSEDTGSIVRTTTLTGIPYNYSAIQIEIVGKNASGSNRFVQFGASSSTFSVVDGAISGNQESYHVYCKIEIKNQMVDAIANAAPGYQGPVLRRYKVITPEAAGWPEGAITGIRIACDGLIVAGATIHIYGVRA